MDLIVLPYLNF